MLKSIIFNLYIYYPIFINILIITILITPEKINKFHPLTLIIILIIITLIISFKINFINYSWIPFFLFLILIGGLIIIYIYISRLSNNKIFLTNYKLIAINLLKITPLLNIYYFLYLIYNDQINSQDLWNLQIDNLINQFNINIIYIKLNNKSLYFIIFYLYYTIICVINICYKNNIPLRQLSKFN